MAKIITQLVGAHFRPPAKQLLSLLPANAPLLLMPEPDNPYDPKAIKVGIIPHITIPLDEEDSLETALSGTGFTAQDILSQEEFFHLGYVADSDGKVCKKSGMAGNREVAAVLEAHAHILPFPAFLQFDMTGAPLVLVEDPEPT